ncbi:MAG: glutathione S-transferase family protein [Ferrovibrio sp.]|uniref:glutathione S-transferase family protein n=1 Tax=Ferrovibrio sp. TaxID=1917215 RepID=UPI00261A2A90|nr:glutathione S-transferase family protein [Ferrovibrio sp.]MCW0232157.1 glutathione S-transferase family protein [Ferrovibrio sp.]
MLVIHHLGISQSDRIVWLCEELGIPYELKRYARDPQTRMAPADYRALTPFGTAPVIDDGDLRLGESAAIIEYIAQTYGDGRLLIRPGAPGYADFLYWFHFANGSFMPAALIDSLCNRLPGGAGAMTALRARLDRAYDQIEDRLGRVPFLAGAAFSAADIMTLFPLTTMRVFSPRDIGPYPQIRAYLQRIAARPAFRRAMQKADPGFDLPLS